MFGCVVFLSFWKLKPFIVSMQTNDKTSINWYDYDRIITSKNVSPSARTMFIIAYVGMHTKDAAAIDQPSPWAHPGYVYDPLWKDGGW